MKYSVDTKRYPRAWGLMEEAISSRSIPGASLCVTQKGQRIILSSFGRFTYEKDSALVRPDTIFDVASLTKVLATTSMAMLLFARKTLHLDQTIAEIIPEFLSSDARRERVTFRMLLAHCSGLPGYVRLFEQARTREELLGRCFTMPLVHGPGEFVEYSDIGFIVLGVALERLAGETLDRFCEREIFAPLSMDHSMFLPPASLRPEIPPTENDSAFRKRVIQGEVHDENAAILDGVAGHAGLFASAPDVAGFAICLLRGGAPLFQRGTIDRFTARQSVPAGTSRALGWDTPSSPSQSGIYFSSRSYGHLGFTGTSLWIDPERELSITLLTNRTWPDRASEGIRQLRPAVHNAIMEELGIA